MRALLRNLYRAMIRLYPASFRSEFGEEMLWIFDEEARRGRAMLLLLDAACAISLRHVRSRTQQTVPVAYYVEIESALPAQRLAQGTLVALYLAVCFGILLAPCIFWAKAAIVRGHSHAHGQLRQEHHLTIP